MPPKPDLKTLRKLRDDRVLAEMTRRVFSAGFAWSMIELKWPGFEEAFLGFEPSRLLSEPEEFWHRLTMDARIVRNGAKITSVRENARFVMDVAKEHGSFGSSCRLAAVRRGRAARSALQTRQPTRRQRRGRCCSGFSATTPSWRRRTSPPVYATPASILRRRRHRSATSRRSRSSSTPGRKKPACRTGTCP